MSQQLSADDILDFQQKEMENDVKMISKNIETIFQILDEYEKLVETKLTT